MIELAAYCTVAGELVTMVREGKPGVFVKWEQALELQSKVEVYEQVLHSIQAARVAMNVERLYDLLELMDQWSYAHRSGNGELSQKEQQERIDKAFERIKEVVT